MIEYKGKTCSIHYNENLIGDLIIKSYHCGYSLGLDKGEVQIDINDILEFVAEKYIKPKLIQCIENTPPLDILTNQINPEE